MASFDRHPRFLTLLGCLRAMTHAGDRGGFSKIPPDIVEWGIHTGLGPIIEYSARVNGVDTACYPPLNSARLTAEVLTHELTQAMNEILDAMPPEIDSLVLLKGISTCEQYYPHPYLRTMRDIDVLIAPEDITCLESQLRRFGYAQTSNNPPEYYTQHHHTMPFHHPGKKIWVEVHSELFPKRLSVSRDPVYLREALTRQVTASTFFGRRVARLKPELQLLYTAAHWGNEFKQIGNVLPMIDVLLLIDKERGTLDLEWVLKQSQNSYSGIYLYLMLSFLNRFQLIEIDDEFLLQLSRHKNISRRNINILHRLIASYLFIGRPFGRWNSQHTVATVWDALTRNQSYWANLLLLPWDILFPPDQPERYSPKRLLGRIGTLLSR